MRHWSTLKAFVEKCSIGCGLAHAGHLLGRRLIIIISLSGLLSDYIELCLVAFLRLEGVLKD